MTPIQKVIKQNNKDIKPIWLMRQAGRYLPEFRKIRKSNPNFVELCLKEKEVQKITLQPINRFKFDAAIIFSDILMVPFALGQDLNFKKNFGPILGDFSNNKIKKISPKVFSRRLKPVYNSIRLVKNNKLLKNRDLIGFVGAPWTILVYMLNRNSPKKKLKKIFKDKVLISDLLKLINKYLSIHIKNQIKSGATVIQIFDSWAGLVNDKDLEDLIYNPTKKLVNYTKSLKVPSICFPRNINNYQEYTDVIKPNVISIDYNVNPIEIVKKIKIPVQGGLNPKILLTNKANIKKKTKHYLDIFRNHPYIFNLGHGVLPNTDPNMIKYLIKTVKNFK